MGDFELVTAEDVKLMQGLAQRVTAVRPELVNNDATFGELAWIWGKGHASDGGTWPVRRWYSGAELMAWSWAYLPHQMWRSDGSVQEITGADEFALKRWEAHGFQTDPGDAPLIKPARR